MTSMFPSMSSTFSFLSLRFSRFSFHAAAFLYCFWPLHKSFHLMTQRKDNCVVSHHTFWQSGTRVLMSKAKEALQKHDQEIQSLSNKAISSPKVRVPFPRDVPHLKKPSMGGVITLNESYETLVPSSLYHVLRLELEWSYKTTMIWLAMAIPESLSVRAAEATAAVLVLQRSFTDVILEGDSNHSIMVVNALLAPHTPVWAFGF